MRADRGARVTAVQRCRGILLLPPVITGVPTVELNISFYAAAERSAATTTKKQSPAIGAAHRAKPRKPII